MLHPDIPTPVSASKNKKFEQWVLFIQKTQRPMTCPRCLTRLRKDLVGKSKLCALIWVCFNCRNKETHEWNYTNWPPYTYENWALFEVFKNECERYGVRWHEDRKS